MPQTRIADKQLEYEWHGPGPEAAPTLVFLHEGLGCVTMWRDFPRRLAEAVGCGALVFSRAGYGNSDPVPLPRPVTFMHEEALVVLPQVLDAFAIRKSMCPFFSFKVWTTGMGRRNRSGRLRPVARVRCAQSCSPSVGTLRTWNSRLIRLSR